MSELSFYQKLSSIQRDLVATKDKENKFGNFSYRTAEGILKAVKPHLATHGLYLSISDEIRMIGDRFYLVAVVSVTDGDKVHTVEGWAREALSKKGMDDSQVTGASSSYARKYALNGMFGIDDSKQDPDTNHGSDEMNAKVDEALASCSTREEAIEKMKAITASPKCNQTVKRYALTEFNRLFPAK